MLHQFTAWFFFTDEFVCLLSDVIRWSRCDLSCVPWHQSCELDPVLVTFNVHLKWHESWDTARWHVGLLRSGYKMLMREWDNKMLLVLAWTGDFFLDKSMFSLTNHRTALLFFQTLKHIAELWKLWIVVHGEFSSIAFNSIFVLPASSLIFVCEIHIATNPNLCRTFSRST